MIDFPRLFGVVRDHVWLFTLITLLVIVGVSAGVQLKSPSYESRAKLLINIDRMHISASRADVKNDIALAQAVEVVTSQAEILRTRALIEKVVDSLGDSAFSSPPPNSALLRRALEFYAVARDDAMRALERVRLVDPVYPHFELIERVQKALTVYPVRQSQIIDIAFRWPNPEVPPRFVASLIQVYLDKVGALSAEASSINLLANETDASKRRLEQDEDQLSELKARYVVHDLDGERHLIMERINKLTVQLEGMRPVPVVDGTSVPKEPGSGADGNVTQLPTITDDTALAALRQTLDLLRIERAKLVSQYSSNYARVEQVNAQIAGAESLVRHEADAVRNNIVAYRRRLQVLDLVEPEMNKIQRAIAIDLDTYQTYRKATEDRRVTSEQDAQVIAQLIDPPSTPYQSVATSRLLLMLAGLCGAPLLAFLFTVLIDAIAPAPQRRRAEGGSAVASKAAAGED